MERSAEISEDRIYRYVLSRYWDRVRPQVGFILLNPSTADDRQDDATVRKCIRLSTIWGFGALTIGNLFAYRSTDPRELRVAKDPIGPGNDLALSTLVATCDVVIAAWGNHGSLLARSAFVRQRFKGKLQALRITKTGEPSHPLYLPDLSKPFPFA